MAPLRPDGSLAFGVRVEDEVGGRSDVPLPPVDVPDAAPVPLLVPVLVPELLPGAVPWVVPGVVPPCVEVWVSAPVPGIVVCAKAGAAPSARIIAAAARWLFM